MTVDEALSAWWDEDAERLNAMATMAREFAVKVPRAKSKEDRAFCPTGEGGGIKNDCSASDGGDSPDDAARDYEESLTPEGAKEEEARRETPFTEKDSAATRSTIKSSDGREIPVITRSEVSSSEYLDEVEKSGRDRGLVVDFDEVKKLQESSDIAEDIGPYAAFVRDGYALLAGNVPAEDNTYETIDYNGSDYGTIDQYVAEEMVTERTDEILEEDWNTTVDHEIEYPRWNEMTDEEKDQAKEEWKDSNRSSAEEQARENIEETRDRARESAVQKMRRDLERDLASTTLSCCAQLYRGMRLDKYTLEEMISSGVVVHEAANSWTTSRRTARGFGAATSVLLVCRNPRAGHVYQEDHSGEAEVTRPPSKMKIVGVVRTSQGNSTVLYLDEDDDYRDDDK